MLAVRKLSDAERPAGLLRQTALNVLAPRLLGAMRRDPDAIEPIVRELRQHGHRQELLDVIEALWATKAQNSAAWSLGCARGWYGMQQPRLGDVALGHAFELAPDWVPLFEEQARVQAGRQHMSAAVQAAQRVITLRNTPDATRYWSEFIGTELFKGGQRQQALTHLKVGEPKDPTWVYWYRRAVSAEELNESSEAQACYRRAGDLRVPTVSAELRTAALHYYQGAVPAAIAELERLPDAAATPSADSERLVLWGRALLRLESVDEAVRRLRARDRASESAEVVQIAALAEELAGDFELAVEEYRSAIDRFGLSLQHRLARSQQAMGRSEEAVDTWLTITDRHALLDDLDPELDPDFETSVRAVAADLDQEDWDAAIPRLKRLAASASSMDNVRRLHQRSGQVLAAAGQQDAALTAFMRGSDELLPHASESEATFAPLGKFERYAAAIEALPLDQGIILYEAFQGAQTSCNPLAMCQYLLIERPDLHHVWAITSDAPIHHSLRGHPRVSFVQIHSDGYRLHLATAGTLVTNNSFPRYFIRRDEQRYLNTWHGFPWKSMGRDIADNSYAYSNLARNLLQATHLSFPDEHTARVMAESTDVADLITAQVMTAGQPRVDRTLRLGAEEKQQLKDRLGLSDDGPVVLYAPTWRGSIGAVDVSVAPYLKAIDTLTQVAGAQVLLSLHHLVAKELDHGKLPQSVTLVPADVDTNELLSVVDVLVSDYSSVIFDFAALGRPIIKYVFDHQAYATDRGLYFDIDEVPGVNCIDESQVLEAVTRAANAPTTADWSSLQTASAWTSDDGYVTGRMVKALFDPPVPEQKKQSDPARILVSVSDLALSDTVHDLFSFLAANPETAQHVQLLVDKDSVDEPENVATASSLHQLVDFTLSMDQRCATRRENLAWARLAAGDQQISGVMLEVLQSRMSRERRRLFGRSRFASIVDLGGHGLHRTALTTLGFPDETTTIRALDGDLERRASDPLAQFDPAVHLMSHFDMLASRTEEIRVVNQRHLAGVYSVPTAIHHQAADPITLVSDDRAPVRAPTD